MMFWNLVAAFLAFISSFSIVNAKVVFGSLSTGQNWHFLARFCFLSLHGRFQYEVEYAEDYGIQV